MSCDPRVFRMLYHFAIIDIAKSRFKTVRKTTKHFVTRGHSLNGGNVIRYIVSFVNCNVTRLPHTSRKLMHVLMLLLLRKLYGGCAYMGESKCTSSSKLDSVGAVGSKLLRRGNDDWTDCANCGWRKGEIPPMSTFPIKIVPLYNINEPHWANTTTSFNDWNYTKESSNILDNFTH